MVISLSDSESIEDINEFEKSKCIDTFIELSTNLCEYDDEVFDEQQNTYNQIYDQWLKIV